MPFTELEIKERIIYLLRTLDSQGVQLHSPLDVIKEVAAMPPMPSQSAIEAANEAATRADRQEAITKLRAEAQRLENLEVISVPRERLRDSNF